MQAASQGVPTPRRRASSRRPRRRAEAAALPLDRYLLVAAAIGLAVSAYLTIVDLAGSGTLCLAGSDCDAVRASEYGRLFGLPLPALGMAFFGAVLGLALARRTALLPVLQCAGGVGLGAAVLFLAIQGAVLGAWCPYCLAADAAALVVAWRTLPRAPGLGLLRGASAAAVAVAVLLAGYALAPTPSPAQAADELSLLADHLKNSGAIFYGAYWCPHCQNQKRIFGTAASRLPYVECDARGAGARPDLCQAANVRSYPTWVIGAERREGEVTIADLKRLSKFGS
ncbi:MAG: vitamin K epoxide reductase family protein [Chloroflexota bacterium]